MKHTILFLLFLSFIVAFSSCSKSGSSTNYLMIADTGSYYVKTGTVTVTTPDSTYIYDASKDQIQIYHDGKHNPNSWSLYCYSVKNNNFYFTCSNAPASNSTSIMSTISCYCPVAKYKYIYQPSTTTTGSVTLNTYNNNGIAASGSFNSSLARYNSTNFLRIGTTNYTVSGSFDLKLTPR